MNIRDSKAEALFKKINTVFLCIAAVLCVLPLVHVLALSFSSSRAAGAGIVTLWPKEFTLEAYNYAIGRSQFWRSMGISLSRILVGLPVNMVLTVLTAYPLYMYSRSFKARNFYAWFFFITILFNGGLVPTYMVVSMTGIRDTLWALILPTAVPVFNIILLLNFFRRLPKEISESAYMDGASHLRILFQIFIPLSKPALATLILFVFVFHWNSWFDGLIYMNSSENYPLQTYLQNIVVARDFEMYSSATAEELKALAEVSDRTTKAAQIFIAAFPILIIYPYLQKHFVKGIVVGSIKG
jgi:putative aldouronate transport system permease protein